MADVVEVLQHWQAKRSLRHVARSTGMGRRRLREILAVARAAGLVTNTVLTVWQRLRGEQGLSVSETTFRRYVHGHVRRVTEKDVTVLKALARPVRSPR